MLTYFLSSYFSFFYCSLRNIISCSHYCSQALFYFEMWWDVKWCDVMRFGMVWCEEQSQKKTWSKFRTRWWLTLLQFINPFATFISSPFTAFVSAFHIMHLIGFWLLIFCAGAFNFTLLSLARVGKLSWFAQMIWNKLRQISLDKKNRKGRRW